MNLGNLILRVTEIWTIIIGVLLLADALKLSPIKFSNLGTLQKVVLGAPLFSTGITIVAITRAEQ